MILQNGMWVQNPLLLSNSTKHAAALVAVQNIVSRQSTQPNVSPSASGVVAPPNTLEELEGATASSVSGDQSHVKSDSSNKQAPSQLWYVNP